MRNAILLLTCGVAMLWGGDPWKDKEPTDWTEKDAAKILTNSPWAKTVTATMSPGMGGGRGGGGMGGGSGGGGRRGGGGGGMGGGADSAGLGGSGEGAPSAGGGVPEAPGGAPGGPRVTVRWETSGALLDALTRVEYSLTPKLREWAKDYYIITAAGMPVRMGGSGRRPGAQPPTGQAAPAPSDPKRLMDQFIQATVLKRKGKDPINPMRIEMLRVADAMVPMFFFSRSDAITDEDKEVVFESAFGPVTVKSKFNLKEMQYGGKLSL